MQSVITKERLERIARIYKTNKDAGSAIGMHPGAFARLCRQHGIVTPYVRQRRETRSAAGTG